MSGAAVLAVRLKPGSKTEGLDGWAADDAGRPYLNARVRARPVDGEANAALEALIAQALGVPKSAVAVARGGTSRLKQLTVDGLDAAEVRRRLDGPLVKQADS